PVAMAGYLAWLAPRLDDLKETALQGVRELQRQMPTEAGRVAENGAKLLFAAGVFLRFAREVGAINEAELATKAAEAQAAIHAGCERTAREQAARRPATLFVEYLTALLVQKAIYLAERREGEAPVGEPGAWGWVVSVESGPGEEGARK